MTSTRTGAKDLPDDEERFPFDLVVQIVESILDSSRDSGVLRQDISQQVRYYNELLVRECIRDNVNAYIARSNEDISIILRNLGAPSFAMLMCELRHIRHCGGYDLLIEYGKLESSDVDFGEGEDGLLGA